MKKIISFFFIVFVGLTSAARVSAQQPSATMPPHAGGAMPNMGPTGMVEGNLFSVDSKGKKTPVTGQEVVMLVFQNGQQVLMLKKTTDAKGHFEYKNIFKNPDFAYGFGAMYDNNLYVYPRLSLGDKDDVKKIDFRIGADSPYWRDPATMGMKNPEESSPPPEAASDPMSGETQNKHAHDNSWSKPYQKMAMGLGVLVLIAAAYLAGKKSSS